MEANIIIIIHHLSNFKAIKQLLMEILHLKDWGYSVIWQRMELFSMFYKLIYDHVNIYDHISFYDFAHIFMFV